ncbi:MAG: hypothetical protein LBD30_02470 [Verrucomicrobiales bacterium]|nr:hypothetical protein [Verrucomicrobiales bacterium]
MSTIWYVTESDAGDAALTREAKTHGATVGFPDYSIGGIIGGGINYRNNSCFGFWPDSKNVYINANRNSGIEIRWRGNMCWFFRADDGESMLFDAGRGKVVTISDDFKVTQVQKFRWADGDIAFPEKFSPT